MIIREASLDDIDDFMEVRMAVKENILNTPSLVSRKDNEEYLKIHGKGWVCEIDKRIIGFSIVGLTQHNVWALFVHPDFEGRGVGRALHNVMLDWYFSQTDESVWLGTAPNTRAERFYRSSGWTEIGSPGNEEIKFIMESSQWIRLNRINHTMPDTSSHFHMTVNDIQTYYIDQGSGAIPLIFIHGFPFDKSSWHPQIDYFSKLTRVIAYDIRGFGKTESGDIPFSIAQFADDLIAVMDALKIEVAIVCGLSMGGYIVLDAVNRFPNRFHAIVLCDTQCNADSEEGKQKRYDTIAEVEQNGLNGFSEGMVKKLVHTAHYKANMELVDQLKSMIQSTKPESVTNGLKALAMRSATCDSLHRIHVPSLIICGKEDELTPVKQSELMHRHIKNSKMEVIEQCGHVSNLEQADIFNALLDSFLSNLHSKDH